MKFDRKSLSDDQLIHIYKTLVKPRMIEEKMLNLLRQGKISKWFSGIGQEAISVGVVLAMSQDEYILPMHRNLGIFTGRNMPFDRLFSQWQGKLEGYSKGRERSFHFGSNSHHIVGMISHLGPQMGVANGIALGDLLDKNGKTTAVFTGDGGTSEGDFHEALNVAAVWNLPVIFVIENNGYGLSTPSVEQFKCKQLIDKAIGYGMEGILVDGNNVLEVYHAVAAIREKMKHEPSPVLLECITFRMRGHEEASGTKYVPEGLMKAWAEKDPVENFERFLQQNHVLNDALISAIRHQIKHEIEAGLKESDANHHYPTPNSEEEINDNFKSFNLQQALPDPSKTKDLRLIDAIKEGMHLALQRHPNLIFMGQDIAEYGGVFKATEGFVNIFGKDRIRNTPLCESAILGAALGLSIQGKKAMVEMQFADFVTSGFNQIVNNLAKSHYRWGQNADVVVRMPTGAGVGAGPYHSQSNEAWFFHTPGLKIAYPAFPGDAKGLLLSAFEDPNPVMFFEHKALYRSISGPVAEGYYTLPFGKANVVLAGSRATLVTYGAGVHWALALAKKQPELSLEIIDLRTLAPLDWDCIKLSVQKTSRLLILHEDNLTGGIGAEIAAWAVEHCFEWLDAPVMRCASLDTPVPFSMILEKNYLPEGRLHSSVNQLLAY